MKISDQYFGLIKMGYSVIVSIFTAFLQTLCLFVIHTNHLNASVFLLPKKLIFELLAIFVDMISPLSAPYTHILSISKLFYIFRKTNKIFSWFWREVFGNISIIMKLFALFFIQKFFGSSLSLSLSLSLSPSLSLSHTHTYF